MSLGLMKVGGSGVFGPGPSSMTWNPADTSADITLSGGNLIGTHTAASSFAMGRGLTSKGSGKWYFEFVVNVNGAATGQGCGLADAAAALSGQFIGGDTDSIGLNSGGNILFGGVVRASGLGAMPSGTRGDVAYDVTAELFWARLSGGLWNASGTANPATGTGGISFAGMTLPVFPALYLQHINDQITGVFSSSGFVDPVPAGFSALP